MTRGLFAKLCIGGATERCVLLSRGVSICVHWVVVANMLQTT